MNAVIIVLGWGGSETCKKWKEETKINLPFLLNDAKEIYHMLGYRRKATNWSLEKVQRQAELKAVGRDKDIPVTYRVDHDCFQLGGDCILDRNGKLIKAYYGETVYDRPPVDLLLGDLKRVI